MNIDFKERLKQSILDDFHSLLYKHPNEEIFAIALLTDSEFTTIRMGIGTISFLHSYSENYNYNSIQEFAGIVWNPEEWFVFSNNLPDSKLFNLQYELNKIYNNSKDIKSYSQHMEQNFIDAFNEVDLTEKFNGKIFKFIYDTDPSNEDYLPNKSSKILNPQEIHELFLNRYNKIFKFYPFIQIKSKTRKLP